MVSGKVDDKDHVQLSGVTLFVAQFSLLRCSDSRPSRMVFCHLGSLATEDKVRPPSSCRLGSRLCGEGRDGSHPIPAGS